MRNPDDEYDEQEAFDCAYEDDLLAGVIDEG